MLITTLRQFITKGEALQAEGRISEMYEVFEDECTDEVAEQVYSLADADSNEPFRSAMCNMGFVNF